MRYTFSIVTVPTFRRLLCRKEHCGWSRLGGYQTVEKTGPNTL